MVCFNIYLSKRNLKKRWKIITFCLNLCVELFLHSINFTFFNYICQAISKSITRQWSRKIHLSQLRYFNPQRTFFYVLSHISFHIIYSQIKSITAYITNSTWYICMNIIQNSYIYNNKKKTLKYILRHTQSSSFWSKKHVGYYFTSDFSLYIFNMFSRH